MTMRMKWAAQLILTLGLCGTAEPVYAAACGGGTYGVPQTPAYLSANEFQDGQAAGSITPGCVRDLIASTAFIGSSTQTASYTLALTDVGTTVQMNLSADGTLTVPPHSSVAFPVGTKVMVRNSDTNPVNIGQVRVALTPGTGVTLDARGSLILWRPNQMIVLWQTAQDVWAVLGNEPTKLVNYDYALTTTDGAGSANIGRGVMQFWGTNSDGASGVSCGPGPGVVPGTGTLSSRIVTQTTGGPNNGRYRQFTVVSGDNWGGFGVRCEIGNLDWRFGEGYNNQYTFFNGGYTATQGTFATFKEGQHRMLDLDVQLESSWTLSSNVGFQEILQVKQANPATNLQNSGSPIIEIGARNNLWQLISTQGATAGSTLSSTAATLSAWYHIRLDCMWTQFTALGWCQMIVTPWSGGVLGIPVVGPLAAGIGTLAVETGTSDILPVGSSIPGALLVGPYVRTGAPTMSLDMTNWEVWETP